MIIRNKGSGPIVDKVVEAFAGHAIYSIGDLYPTVDTSPIAIGWAVGQDDEEGNWFAIRFGARILTERQRAYP